MQVDPRLSDLPDPISESTFAMWRAVFAFALVDNVLSIEEQELLKVYKDKVPFTDAQLDILRRDFIHRQDVEALHARITDKSDRQRFCVLARALVWSDGNMDEQERKILQKVACLAGGEGRETLTQTRGHVAVEKYYQQYARAGVVGLLHPPHILELNA